MQSDHFLDYKIEEFSRILMVLIQHLLQVMVDWDEFLDNQSGRKFYYNTITKEKSWKPPRKTKGTMGEGKTNTTKHI